MNSKKDSPEPQPGSKKSTRSLNEQLLDEVGERVLYSVLEDVKAGVKMAPTAKLQLATSYMKIVEKRPPEPADAGKPTDVLDLIETADLSPERKHSLLDKEIQRTKDRLTALLGAKEKL